MSVASLQALDAGKTRSLVLLSDIEEPVGVQMAISVMMFVCRLSANLQPFVDFFGQICYFGNRVSRVAGEKILLIACIFDQKNTKYVF